MAQRIKIHFLANPNPLGGSSFQFRMQNTNDSYDRTITLYFTTTAWFGEIGVGVSLAATAQALFDYLVANGTDGHVTYEKVGNDIYAWFFDETSFFVTGSTHGISGELDVTIETLDYPNLTLTYEPGANSLNAAYRPIIFRCKARKIDATVSNYVVPMVFCDVYLNGTYYKTFSKSQFINDDGIAPEYEFDIQDALQEVMTYNLPAIDGSAILEMTNTVKTASVSFRNAFIDENGFIKTQQLAPIQGTSGTAPVAGIGVDSNDIYVYNATLQHEENQDYAAFLNSYKTGTWSSNSFPLTKRPKNYKLCKTDSSYFPIISDTDPASLCLTYKLAGQAPTTVCKTFNPPSVNCPVISGLTAVTSDYLTTQIITLSWDNPGDLSVTDITFKWWPSGDPGSFAVVTENLASLAGEYNISFPFGLWDFIVYFSGSCQTQVPSSAQLTNIGLNYNCPVILGGVILDPVDNGDGTQTITITWSSVDYDRNHNFIYQYYPVGDPGSVTGGSIVEAPFPATDNSVAVNVPIGKYNFFFYYSGYCKTDVDLAYNIGNVGVIASISVPDKSITVSKTLEDVSTQATAYRTLAESLVYAGYTNSLGVAYGNVVIQSVPDHGEVTLHGEVVTVGYVCALSEIAAGNFEFWPVGYDGTGTFESYVTSFTYKVLDANGDESNIVTMTITFTAL